jgi:hypothetical protein
MTMMIFQSNLMPDADWVNNATSIEGLVVNLWAVYVAIAAATLALITSGRKTLESMNIRILIVAAYLGSALVNLFAMLNLRAQHDILAYHVSDADLQWHMLQPRPWEYILAHGLIDIGICIAVILVPGRPCRSLHAAEPDRQHP